MTDYKVGDIVLVPFPFTDVTSSKRRPALLLSRISAKTLPPLVVLAMVTSQVETEKIVGDYRIHDWEGAGLIHDSKVRLAKLVTIEEDLILRTLGKLGKEARKGVQKQFWQVFSEWRR